MKPTRLILIDDDILDINMCRINAEHACPEIEVVTFTLPEEGLHFIETSFNNNATAPSVLFLDINMPIITGWEFLEKYDLLEKKIREKIAVYILSSSVDSRDKDKAASNRNIKGYLEKPINRIIIENILGEDIIIAS